ncbi:uncharacterized protein LOC114729522 [Neltuma alba]|uniref:uncharacterized protein LOC114729522 n=1 Tax=Neltuma alba TaxID=207710 RepID=UPI0010A35D6D|nr:uncharacterized protein LOC114729522 [Prosopis alba]
MSDTIGAPRNHLCLPPKFSGWSRNLNSPVQQEPPLLGSAPDPIAEERAQTNRRRSRRRRKRKLPLHDDPQVRIAMYVAMAHAGLALSLAVLYGVTKLLQNYWRPILWAILCSIPLRELHTALVSFWSHSLNLGLLHALLAIPLSALNVTCSSLIDSHAALLRLLRYPSPLPQSKFGFSKLMQWLISFGLFIVLYERIGSFSVPAFLIPCSLYASGFGKVKMRKLTSISSIKFRSGHNSSFGSKISSCLTSIMLNRLKTIVGIGLIMFMIVGTVFGLVFFSYKIALEGKDAVISLKVHLHKNDYAERIGVKKWMDENHIPELIDSYATKVSETLLQNIDSLAAYYNVTEIVHGVRNYLISHSQGSVKSSVPVQANVRPVSQKLSYIQSRVRNGQWKNIYSDIDGLFRELASLIAREGLMGELKALLRESLDVSKRLLTCGANILLYMAVSIVSGAAGLVNFISELTVFLWLLYYLMTSESGGVMDHVLDMVPISKSTRVQCAQVLDHAVSSVLLATAKLTWFQGCLTYLLFRFYHIHFLYTSTSLSLMSAILPITPAPLLATIPAAAQLAMEKRYIEAILLTIMHQILLEYGTQAIQDEIPGHNAYLTGLSILGGIAVFPSALEVTLLWSDNGSSADDSDDRFKRLYAEFVLGSTHETAR